MAKHPQTKTSRDKSRNKKKPGQSRGRVVESFPLVGSDDIVPIPGLVFPITPTESGEIEAIRFAIQEGSPIIVAATKRIGAGSRKPRKLCTVGGLANVIHSIRLPNGDMRIKVHVQGRVRIDETLKRPPFVRA